MQMLRGLRLPTVAGLIVCALIAWLSIRAAAIGILGGLGDAAPLGFVANAPAVIDITLRRTATGRLDATAARALDARARDLLARQPLAFNAAFASAMANAELGEDARAEALMRLTVVRNPRNRVARSWLVSKALQRARYDDALIQLDAIMRMQPELAVPMTTVMVRFLLAPGMVDAFAKAAQRGAPWMPAFLDQARRDESVTGQVYALTEQLARQGGNALPAASAVQVIQSAVSRGHFREARAVLIASNPAARADPANMLLDAAFQSAAPTGEFDWRLAAPLPQGAEVTIDGRLQVLFDAASVGELVYQDIIAGPGAYTFSVVLHGSPQGTAGAAVWQLRCLQSGAIVASLPLVPNPVANARESVDAIVPPGCGMPRLSLMNAREGASASAAISRVALRRQP